jgi:hypothetical protein
MDYDGDVEADCPQNGGDSAVNHHDPTLDIGVARIQNQQIQIKLLAIIGYYCVPIIANNQQ